MIDQFGQIDAFPDTVVKDASLKARFVVPPFSVLDARQGYWQERKRAWLALGIQGEMGRDIYSLTGQRPWQVEHGEGHQPAIVEDAPGAINQRYADKPARVDLWRMKNHGDFDAFREQGKAGALPGSVFDPVLAEVVYRWFMPARGWVIDPFAGEATKGLVAAYLGHLYTGIELRAEQVEANQLQAKTLEAYFKAQPQWYRADALNLLDVIFPSHKIGGVADLIFTSPPYYDLEIYSRDGADGSVMPSYTAFMAWQAAIYQQCVTALAPNRFFVVKVGEVRDKGNGAYRNFVGDTVTMLCGLGLSYYNDAVFITPVGSLPIRVGQQFQGSRKLGRGHQTLLVFYKGDTKHIGLHFPKEVEFGGTVTDPVAPQAVTG